MEQTNLIKDLPIHAFELRMDENNLAYLRSLGPSDCIIIYSDLSPELTEKCTSRIAQPFTLIKAGIAPLELK